MMLVERGVDGLIVGHAEVHPDQDVGDVLSGLIDAMRKEWIGDIDVTELIPNDKGFIEPHMFLAISANDKSRNAPQYVRGHRNSHVRKFSIKAGERVCAQGIYYDVF